MGCWLRDASSINFRACIKRQRKEIEDRNITYESAWHARVEDKFIDEQVGDLGAKRDQRDLGKRRFRQ